MIVGTPEYLSPEQARGQTVDARSDLYAVGLILFEMLAGELPFSGGTPAEMVIQRILRPPPSLAKARPDLPRWLHAFSDRLLKVNPAHRFESAKTAIRAFETRRVPRPPLNWRAFAVAASVAVAVAALGAWAWSHPGTLSRLFAPVASPTPRVAVLPFLAPAGDTESTALARALDEHVRQWLRGDPALAAVPRRRLIDALARVAPDATAETVLRQAPEIAQAANATRLWRAVLKRDKDQLELTLADVAETTGKPLLQVRAATSEALYEAYLKAAATLFSSERWHVGTAPTLAPAAVLPLGRALLALDDNRAGEAAKALPASQPAAEVSALVEKTRLDAEEADRQQLTAQNTRETIVTHFANGLDPLAREIYAHALAGEGDVEKALPALTAATQAFPHDNALALLDADVLAANGDSDKALPLLQRIAKNDDQDARVWFLLGRTAIQQGQPRIAVEDYLTRALVLYSRAGNAAAEAETRNALGIGYDRLGQPDAAIEQYTRAAAMREKLGDAAGLGKTLRNLAIVQSVSGQRDAAEKTLDRAKTILEGIGDRASLGDLYNDRGVVAEENGDFAAALAAYREALAIRQQLDVPNLVAESLDNVGFSSFQLGRFDDALVYWQQALAMYQKLDDRNKMLRVEQNMGVLDTARGHFATAEKTLQAALNTAQDNQLTELVSVAHIDLAELALAQGRYADATTHSARAAEIARRRSDRRTETEAKLQLARGATALGLLGELDAALSSIEAADLGSEQRAAFELAMARRAMLADDGKTAIAKLDEASRAAVQSHSGLIDMQIRFARARMALAAKDRESANRFLKSIRDETSRLNEVPLRLQWLELEIAAALGNGDKAGVAAHYRQAVALLKDVGDYAYSTTIHALAARALPPGSEADAARAAADAARGKLLAAAPENARPSLAAQLDRRLHEESPADAR
jgi:tetratricopeptide (TPR) repeat protein